MFIPSVHSNPSSSSSSSSLSFSSTVTPTPTTVTNDLPSSVPQTSSRAAKIAKSLAIGLLIGTAAAIGSALLLSFGPIVLGLATACLIVGAIGFVVTALTTKASYDIFTAKERVATAVAEEAAATTEESRETPSSRKEVAPPPQLEVPPAASTKKEESAPIGASGTPSFINTPPPAPPPAPPVSAAQSPSTAKTTFLDQIRGGIPLKKVDPSTTLANEGNSDNDWTSDIKNRRTAFGDHDDDWDDNLDSDIVPGKKPTTTVTDKGPATTVTDKGPATTEQKAPPPAPRLKTTPPANPSSRDNLLDQIKEGFALKKRAETDVTPKAEEAGGCFNLGKIDAKRAAALSETDEEEKYDPEWD